MKILRWIAAIPVSMVAGWLVIFLAFQIFGATADPEKSTGSVLLLLAAAASGAIAIFVASAIAPSHKKMLAWILTILSVGLLSLLPPTESFAERSIYIAQNIGCVVMAALISLRHTEPRA
jgi:hypothetical protein